MAVENPFTSHPSSIGESYGQHLAFASGIGLRMILGGFACMAHGLLPFVFTRTGSRTIVELYGRVSWGARANATKRIKAEFAA
jgi:hypothetical protein